MVNMVVVFTSCKLRVIFLDGYATGLGYTTAAFQITSFTKPPCMSIHFDHGNFGAAMVYTTRKWRHSSSVWPLFRTGATVCSLGTFCKLGRYSQGCPKIKYVFTWQLMLATIRAQAGRPGRRGANCKQGGGIAIRTQTDSRRRKTSPR